MHSHREGYLITCRTVVGQIMGTWALTDNIWFTNICNNFAASNLRCSHSSRSDSPNVVEAT